MDMTTISNLSNSGLSLGAVFTAILLSMLAVLIRWRTGSSLTLLSRLWKLFHGKTNATVPFIKEHLDSQASVMELRFKIGVPARTEQHARRLTAWGADHDESLVDAVRCGPHFDFERPGLKDPSEQPTDKAIAGISMLFLICAVMALCFLWMTSADRALLKLKPTGTWFSMTAQDVRPLFAEGFQLKNCPLALSGKLPLTGFTAADIKLLCDAVREEEPAHLASYLKQSLASQRGLFGGFMLLFIIPLFPLYATVRHSTNANAMRERLRRKAVARADTSVPGKAAPLEAQAS